MRVGSSEEVSPETEKAGCVLWGAAAGGLNRRCLLKMSFPLLLMTVP